MFGLSIRAINCSAARSATACSGRSASSTSASACSGRSSSSASATTCSDAASHAGVRRGRGQRQAENHELRSQARKQIYLSLADKTGEGAHDEDPSG